MHVMHVAMSHICLTFDFLAYVDSLSSSLLSFPSVLSSSDYPELGYFEYI